MRLAIPNDIHGNLLPVGDAAEESAPEGQSDSVILRRIS